MQVPWTTFAVTLFGRPMFLLSIISVSHNALDAGTGRAIDSNIEEECGGSEKNRHDRMPSADTRQQQFTNAGS